VGPQAVGIADVNMDGKKDLIVPNFNSNTVGVFLGNGNGTFQAQKTFTTDAGPYSVATADVNGDGRVDVVTACFGAGTASVMLGDVPPTVLSVNRTTPAGPVTSASSVGYTVTFNEPVTGVDSGDFTLALGGVSASTPVVSGGPSVYTVTVNGITGSGTLGLNVVDDGTIKDAAGNPLQPGGVAAFGAMQTFATGSSPYTAIATDVNGDGKPDLVADDEGSGTLSVLLGNGNGTFGPRTVLSGWFPAFDVSACDVNRDGRMDLELVDIFGRVFALLGNGNGTFQAGLTFLAPTQARTLVASDVNGDGKPDIVITSRGTDETTPGFLSVFLGNGDGRFGAGATFTTGAYPRSLSVTDMNGDGKPDAVVGNWWSGTVGVLLGNGNGTFAGQKTFASGSFDHPMLAPANAA